MAILYTIYLIISGVLIFFLLIPFVSVVLSFVSREKVKDIKKGDPDYRAVDYGCIITAYKNAEITKPGVLSLLRQIKFLLEEHS